MTRAPLHCTICDTPLAGGLDTYGEVGEELCWACYSTRAFPRLIIEQEFEDLEDWQEFLEENGIPDDGLIERDGMLFCWSCGMLAQPGDELFDWCSHINETRETCPYMYESVFDEGKDGDEWEGEWEE